MTVKQLEHSMATLRSEGRINDNTSVFVCQLNDEYDNSLVEQAVVRDITFRSDENGDPALETCLVITDNDFQTIKECRKCGCTDWDCRQCIEKTGAPCSWVESDLCSACNGGKEVQNA